jgi:hypothetical protein
VQLRDDRRVPAGRDGRNERIEHGAGAGGAIAREPGRDVARVTQKVDRLAVLELRDDVAVRIHPQRVLLDGDADDGGQPLSRRLLRRQRLQCRQQKECAGD